MYCDFYISYCENLRRQYERASMNLRMIALKDFPAMNVSIIEHASRSLAVNLVFFCFQLHTDVNPGAAPCR